MLNDFDKNIRHYPKKGSVVDFRVKSNVIALPPHMPHGPVVERTGGKGPGEDGWESLDGEDEGPIQAMQDDGCVIYPREEDEENLRVPSPGIHSISARDGYTNDLEDCNDWGGLINRDIINNKPPRTNGPSGLVDVDLTDTAVEVDTTDISDLKYGRGPLSDQDDSKHEKTAAFYYSFFTQDTEQFTWLIPGVLAGGGHPIYYSFQDNLNYLRDAGFKAIVSAFEIPIETKHLTGMDYLFVPTLDGYSSHLIEVCEFISRMEDEGKPVFIHCFAGHGRTGTVLAAYLLYKNYLTADEAIEYIRQKYNKLAIETSYQEDELYRLATRL